MVFTLFRRALANSKDHMSMSVRKIQMNETESKNDHLVITHQPFLLHDFFPQNKWLLRASLGLRIQESTAEVQTLLFASISSFLPQL